MTKEDSLRIENDILRARLQDLAAMLLEGRTTREDEPVRNISQPRFMKALAKARKHFGPKPGADK